MFERDERMRVLAEMLKMMRVIKFYAWEMAFKNFIHQIRTKELIALNNAHIFTSIGDMIWMTAIPLVSRAYTVLMCKNDSCFSQ